MAIVVIRTVCPKGALAQSFFNNRCMLRTVSAKGPQFSRAPEDESLVDSSIEKGNGGFSRSLRSSGAIDLAKNASHQNEKSFVKNNTQFWGKPPVKKKLTSYHKTFHNSNDKTYPLYSFTFTPYVNESPSLQALLHLGVKLFKVEQMDKAGDIFVKLDVERHIKPMVRFLVEYAHVPMANVGRVLTHNPWIFQENMDDLEVRINYLESMNFSQEAIARIIWKAPLWLNFKVEIIDRRLGFIQKEFDLSGDELRFVVTRLPSIVIYGTGHLQVINFAVNEIMGFKRAEMRKLILKAPEIFIKKKEHLENIFDYLHHTIGFSHERILSYPAILACPIWRVVLRHEFLRSLNRDQYDKTKPNYVSLEALTHESDEQFCEKVGKCAVGFYNHFLQHVHKPPIYSQFRPMEKGEHMLYR